LILKNKKEVSYDYIVLFAELVRSSLNNSNNDFIPIEEEMEFLEVYLKLEKLRFGNEFTYEIITNEIDDIYIPSLIIQPFLENSLLHGLMHKKGNKKLTIEFDLGEELLCIITDNGVGREEAKRIKERRGGGHESFAMSAIEERLNLLSERFNYNYQFQVEDLYEYDIPIGTRITLSIPFKEEYY
jgi:LytS/YehU family sensor histidine kinase